MTYGAFCEINLTNGQAMIALSVVGVFDDDVVGRAAGFEFDEARCDGAEDGAHVEAEVAADAFIGDDRFAGAFFDDDGLMAAVEAADGAAAAADAEVVVDFGDNLEIAVEVLAGDDVGERLADEIAQGGEAVLEHEDFEAVFHVFDDAIAVLHDGCRDLEVFSAEEEEFNGILPCLDATDAGDRDVCEVFVHLELGEEAKRDGLDGRAGITGDRGFAVDDGHAGDIFEVDVADRLDRVDAGDGIRAALDCGFGGDFHVGDVRGHFGDDGNIRVFFDDARVFFDEFRGLADIGTHGVRGHLRAAEVEFEHICAGFCHFASEKCPFLFVCAHDGDAHDLCGIVMFEAFDYLGIFLPAVFRDLLHVFEADPADVLFADIVEARGALVHAVDADGFVEDAAPAEVEAFGDHFIVVADRRGGEEKRVFAVDAEEIDREINFFGHI